MSIVVRAAFPIQLLTPNWFANQRLIGSGELEQTRIDVFTPQVTTFEMDWFKFQGGQEFIQFTTQNPDEFERLRDIALGTLKALPDVPVSVLGINRDTHFQIEKAEQLYALGDALAPKNIWDGILSFPGLTAYHAISGREDNYSGNRNIRIETSSLLSSAVFVAHNDHYSLHESVVPVTTREQVVLNQVLDPLLATTEKNEMACHILENDWGHSFKRAIEVIDLVYGLAFT